MARPRAWGPSTALRLGRAAFGSTSFRGGRSLLTNGVWIKRPELDEAGDDGELIETASGDVWMTGEHGCDFFKAGQPMRREPIGPDARFCQNEQGLWVVNETNVFAVRGSPPGSAGAGLAGDQHHRGGEQSRAGFAPGNHGGRLSLGRRADAVAEAGQGRSRREDQRHGLGGRDVMVATDRAMARYDGNWRVIPSEAGLSLTGGINSLLAADRRLWLGCVNGLFLHERRGGRPVFLRRDA